MQRNIFGVAYVSNIFKHIYMYINTLFPPADLGAFANLQGFSPTRVGTSLVSLLTTGVDTEVNKNGEYSVFI